MIAINFRSRQKPNRYIKFVSFPIFGELRPRLFYGRLLPRFTVHLWQSLVCWPTCAKPANGVECKIYGGWVLSRL